MNIVMDGESVVSGNTIVTYADNQGQLLGAGDSTFGWFAFYTEKHKASS